MYLGGPASYDTGAPSCTSDLPVLFWVRASGVVTSLDTAYSPVVAGVPDVTLTFTFTDAQGVMLAGTVNSTVTTDEHGSWSVPAITANLTAAGGPVAVYLLIVPSKAAPNPNDPGNTFRSVNSQSDPFVRLPVQHSQEVSAQFLDTSVVVLSGLALVSSSDFYPLLDGQPVQDVIIDVYSQTEDGGQDELLESALPTGKDGSWKIAVPQYSRIVLKPRLNGGICASGGPSCFQPATVNFQLQAQTFAAETFYYIGTTNLTVTFGGGECMTYAGTMLLQMQYAGGNVFFQDDDPQKDLRARIAVDSSGDGRTINNLPALPYELTPQGVDMIIDDWTSVGAKTRLSAPTNRPRTAMLLWITDTPQIRAVDLTLGAQAVIYQYFAPQQLTFYQAATGSGNSIITYSQETFCADLNAKNGSQLFLPAQQNLPFTVLLRVQESYGPLGTMCDRSSGNVSMLDFQNMGVGKYPCGYTPNGTAMGGNGDAGCLIPMNTATSNETVSGWLTVVMYINTAAAISQDTSSPKPGTLLQPQWSQSVLYYVADGSQTPTPDATNSIYLVSVGQFVYPGHTTLLAAPAIVMYLRDPPGGCSTAQFTAGQTFTTQRTVTGSSTYTRGGETTVSKGTSSEMTDCQPVRHTDARATAALIACQVLLLVNILICCLALSCVSVSQKFAGVPDAPAVSPEPLSPMFGNMFNDAAAVAQKQAQQQATIDATKAKQEVVTDRNTEGVVPTMVIGEPAPAYVCQATTAFHVNLGLNTGASSTVTHEYTSIISNSYSFSQTITTSAVPNIIDGDGDLMLVETATYSVADSIQLMLMQATAPGQRCSVSQFLPQSMTQAESTVMWVSVHDINNVLLPDITRALAIENTTINTQGAQATNDLNTPGNASWVDVLAFQERGWRSVLADAATAKAGAVPWPEFMNNVQSTVNQAGVQVASGLDYDVQEPTASQLPSLVTADVVESVASANQKSVQVSASELRDEAEANNEFEDLLPKSTTSSQSSITFFGATEQLRVDFTMESTQESSSALNINSNAFLKYSFNMDKDNGKSSSVNNDEVDFTASVAYSATSGSTQSGTNAFELFFCDPDQGDMFEVEIRKDPLSGSPVYATVGGQSKCPHELNTAERDGVQLLWQQGSSALYGLDPNDTPTTVLSMQAVSQTGEGAYYSLSITSESNLNDLLIMAAGQWLAAAENNQSSALFWIDAGQTLPVVLQLTRPMGAYYDFDDVQLVAAGMPAQASAYPSGLCATVTTSLSVEFDPPCSLAQFAGLLAVQNRFQVNADSQQQKDSQGRMRTVLPLTIYNPESSTPARRWLKSGRLQHIYVQYRMQGDTQWLDAAAFNPSWPSTTCQPVLDLLCPANQLDGTDVNLVSWDVSDLPDGAYEIQLATQCTGYSIGQVDPSGHYSTTSGVIPGVIDVTLPSMFGMQVPTPGGSYNPGDPIQITFTESITCGSVLGPFRHSAWASPPGTTLAAPEEDDGQPRSDYYAGVLLQYSCSDNVVSLQFNEPVWDWLSGLNVTVSIDGVYDDAQNSNEFPIVWTFQVNDFDTAQSAAQVSGLSLAQSFASVADDNGFDSFLAQELATLLSQYSLTSTNGSSPQSRRLLSASAPLSISSSAFQIGKKSGSTVVDFRIVPVPGETSPSYLAHLLRAALDAGAWKNNSALPLLSTLLYTPVPPQTGFPNGSSQAVALSNTLTVTIQPQPLEDQAPPMTGLQINPDGTLGIMPTGATSDMEPSVNFISTFDKIASTSTLQLRVALPASVSPPADWLQPSVLNLSASYVRYFVPDSVDYDLLADAAPSVTRVQTDSAAECMVLADDTGLGFTIFLWQVPTAPGGTLYSVSLQWIVGRAIQQSTRIVFVAGPPLAPLVFSCQQPAVDLLDLSFHPQAAGLQYDSTQHQQFELTVRPSNATEQALTGQPNAAAVTAVTAAVSAVRVPPACITVLPPAAAAEPAHLLFQLSCVSAGNLALPQAGNWTVWQLSLRARTISAASQQSAQLDVVVAAVPSAVRIARVVPDVQVGAVRVMFRPLTVAPTLTLNYSVGFTIGGGQLQYDFAAAASISPYPVGDSGLWYTASPVSFQSGGSALSAPLELFVVARSALGCSEPVLHSYSPPFIDPPTNVQLVQSKSTPDTLAQIPAVPLYEVVAALRDPRRFASVLVSWSAADTASMLPTPDLFVGYRVSLSCAAGSPVAFEQTVDLPPTTLNVSFINVPLSGVQFEVTVQSLINSTRNQAVLARVDGTGVQLVASVGITASAVGEPFSPPLLDRTSELSASLALLPSLRAWSGSFLLNATAGVVIEVAWRYDSPDGICSAAWTAVAVPQPDLLRDDLDVVGSTVYSPIVVNSAVPNPKQFLISCGVSNASCLCGLLVFGEQLQVQGSNYQVQVFPGGGVSLNQQPLLQLPVFVIGTPSAVVRLSARQLNGSWAGLRFDASEYNGVREPELNSPVPTLNDIGYDCTLAVGAAAPQMLPPQAVTLTAVDCRHWNAGAGILSHGQVCQLAVAINLGSVLLAYGAQPISGSAWSLTLGVSAASFLLPSSGATASLQFQSVPAAIPRLHVQQVRLNQFRLMFTQPVSSAPILGYTASFALTGSIESLTVDAAATDTLAFCQEDGAVLPANATAQVVGPAALLCLLLTVPMPTGWVSTLSGAVQSCNSVGCSAPQLQQLFPAYVPPPTGLTVTELLPQTPLKRNLVQRPLTLLLQWDLTAWSAQVGGADPSQLVGFDVRVWSSVVSAPAVSLLSNGVQLRVNSTTSRVVIPLLDAPYQVELRALMTSTQNELKEQELEVRILTSQPAASIWVPQPTPTPVFILSVEQTAADSVLLVYSVPGNGTLGVLSAALQQQPCNLSANDNGLVDLQSTAAGEDALLVHSLPLAPVGQSRPIQLAVQQQQAGDRDGAVGWSAPEYVSFELMGVPNAPDVVSAYQLPDTPQGRTTLQLTFRMLGLAPTALLQLTITTSAEPAPLWQGNATVATGVMVQQVLLHLQLGTSAWLRVDATAVNTAGASALSSFEFFSVWPAPDISLPPNCCQLRLDQQTLRLSRYTDAPVARLDSASQAWLRTITATQTTVANSQLTCAPAAISAWRHSQSAWVDSVQISLPSGIPTLSSLLHYFTFDRSLALTPQPRDAATLALLEDARYEMQLVCQADGFTVDSVTGDGSAARRLLYSNDDSSGSFCSRFTDCRSCTEQFLCGFCTGSQSCMVGGLLGPFDSCYAGWAWTESQCGASEPTKHTSDSSSSSTGGRIDDSSSFSSTGSQSSSSALGVSSSTAGTAHLAASSTAGVALSSAGVSSSSSGPAPSLPHSWSSSSAASVLPPVVVPVTSPVSAPTPVSGSSSWWETLERDAIALAGGSFEPIWPFAPVSIQLTSIATYSVQLQPGAMVQAGFSLSLIGGGSRAERLYFLGGSVHLRVLCSGGTSTTVSLYLPPAVYTMYWNSTWLPSESLSSPLTYQSGMSLLPDACGGGASMTLVGSSFVGSVLPATVECALQRQVMVQWRVSGLSDEWQSGAPDAAAAAVPLLPSFFHTRPDRASAHLCAQFSLNPDTDWAESPFLRYDPVWCAARDWDEELPWPSRRLEVVPVQVPDTQLYQQYQPVQVCPGYNETYLQVHAFASAAVSPPVGWDASSGDIETSPPSHQQQQAATGGSGSDNDSGAGAGDSVTVTGVTPPPAAGSTGSAAPAAESALSLWAAQLQLTLPRVSLEWLSDSSRFASQLQLELTRVTRAHANRIRVDYVSTSESDRGAHRRLLQVDSSASATTFGATATVSVLPSSIATDESVSDLADVLQQAASNTSDAANSTSSPLLMGGWSITGDVRLLAASLCADGSWAIDCQAAATNTTDQWQLSAPLSSTLPVSGGSATHSAALFDTIPPAAAAMVLLFAILGAVVFSVLSARYLHSACCRRTGRHSKQVTNLSVNDVTQIGESAHFQSILPECKQPASVDEDEDEDKQPVECAASAVVPLQLPLQLHVSVPSVPPPVPSSRLRLSPLRLQSPMSNAASPRAGLAVAMHTAADAQQLATQYRNACIEFGIALPVALDREPIGTFDCATRTTAP